MPTTEADLAKRAVERGLITQEQLDACYAERRRLLQDGLGISIRDLILDRGLLDERRWAGLADAEPAGDPAGSAGPPPAIGDTRAEPPAVGEPPAVEVLGGYRIVRELGRGAMGVVYEATQERLARRVALKVLPEVHALSDVARERFLREARATAALKHPGIVPLYDIGQERGIHFFAMELVDGRPLKEILEERRPAGLPPAEAAGIARQAAEALAYAHAQGVTHRDVKPDNILVRPDGRAVLTDFGLAQRTQDATLTREGTIVGTPLYMAPEQALGDGTVVDRRADVYGLGVTLYEALAGRAPFEQARDTAVLLDMVLHDEPRPLRRVAPGVPEGLAAIVGVAIEKDRERRYPDAAALAADLGRFLAGDPVRARPPSPAVRLWRLARRRSRAILVASAVLSALLIVGVSLRLVALRWRAESLVLDAIHLQSAGDHAGARAVLDEALAVWPELAEGHFRRAELIVAEGDAPELALLALDEALTHDPDHSGALLARGALRREGGETAAALADFRRARELAGDNDPRPHLAEGLVLAGSDDAAGAAVERLRTGLDLARRTRATRDPLYAQAVRALGRLELEQGRPEAALPELEEAVRLAPEAVEPQILLARALSATGRDLAAVEALSAALRRNPGHLGAHELRGKTFRRLGAWPEAMADLTTAAERPSARLARGLLQFETVGHLTEQRVVRFADDAAAEDLLAAADDVRLPAAERALAFMALGWLELCKEKGYKARALEHFERALELRPGASGARLARGLVLLRWGHLDEAARVLEALDGEPGVTYAARVARARLARERGDHAAARALLDAAVTLDAERPTAYATRYRVRRAAGDPAASEDQARARELSGAGPPDEAAAFGADADPYRLSERAQRRGYAALEAALNRAGGSWAWSHHLSRAAAWLGRALEFDPENLPALARLAHVLYLAGEFEPAGRLFAEAARLDPGLVEAEVHRALIRRDALDDAAGAVRILEEVVGRAAPGVEAGAVRYHLARCLTDAGRLEDALAAVEAALEDLPERHCAASLRARLLSLLDRPGLEAAVERASALFYEGQRSRGLSRLYATAADELEEQDRRRAALHFADRAVEADPTHADAWRIRSSVHFGGPTDEIPLAFVDAFVSADLQPAYTRRFLELESRIKRFVSVLPMFHERVDDFLRETPDLPAASFFKGYLQLYGGRPAEAEGWFDRAFELSRERSYLSLTYRAASRLRQGRPADALEDLERADRLLPDGPLAGFWRACVLADAGDVEGAARLLVGLAERGDLFPAQLDMAPELAEVRDDPRLRRLLSR